LNKLYLCDRQNLSYSNSRRQKSKHRQKKSNTRTGTSVSNQRAASKTDCLTSHTEQVTERLIFPSKPALAQTKPIRFKHARLLM